jgi:biopolymer transport protein ExbD
MKGARSIDRVDPMKLATRRKHRNGLELSMTSMIDVVFLLLIFFIVTTTFVRPERQIQSAIRVNESRETTDISNLDPAIIEIVRLGPEVVFKIGAIQTNDLDEIKTILRDFDNKSEGAFIRVADNVPFEAAAQAIGVCKASGFPTVSYLPGN